MLVFVFINTSIFFDERYDYVYIYLATTVQSVYKEHGTEHEYVPFMGSRPLYRGSKLFTLFVKLRN